MELSVVGSSQGVAVSDDVFGREFNEHLVHQLITAYRAAGRAGTQKQLTRGEMSGTTKKFKKQKGGGARHGDYRAPIFVGGGRAFAARPRSYAQKVNRKMYRAGIATMLSELNRHGRLMIVDALEVAQPKTRDLVAKLGELKVTRPLLVTENGNEALFLAARNLPYVQVRDVQGLDPVALASSDYVVMTVDAVKKVEEWLA
jgi:large subunit ribosomal protein L4